MRQQAEAFAPGKLILSGEHAVVYGHRALAAAVSLGTTVGLRRREGPSSIEQADFEDPRLLPALLQVLDAQGIGIQIRTTLPVGCGMGSSAALAVATIRAWAALNGEEADFSRCYTDAFRMERVFHGTPSGIDHSISALGGLLIYRRGALGPELEPFHLSHPLHLVVVDTGPPQKSTAELVAGVRERAPMVALEAIGGLTERVITALQQSQPVGLLLDENHHLLQEIGVSTPALDATCRRLRELGAQGAKLAGAGGGGVAFGLFESRRQREVVGQLQAEGLRAWAVQVGTDGKTLNFKDA